MLCNLDILKVIQLKGKIKMQENLANSQPISQLEEKKEEPIDLQKNAAKLIPAIRSDLGMSDEENSCQMQIAIKAIQKLSFADLVIMKQIFGNEDNVNALIYFEANPDKDFFLHTGLTYNLPYITENFFKHLNNAAEQKEDSKRFFKFLLILSPEQNKNLLQNLTELIKQQSECVTSVTDFITLMESFDRNFPRQEAFDLLKHTIFNFVNSVKDIWEVCNVLSLVEKRDNDIQINLRKKLGECKLTAGEFIGTLHLLSVKNCLEILNDQGQQMLNPASPKFVDDLICLLHWIKVKNNDLPNNVLLQLPNDWQLSVKTPLELAKLLGTLNKDQISFIWCDHFSHLITSSLREFLYFMDMFCWKKCGFSFYYSEENPTVIFNCLNASNPNVWSFIKTIEDLNSVTERMIPYTSFKLCQQLLGTVIKSSDEIEKIKNVYNKASLKSELEYLQCKKFAVIKLGKFAPPATQPFTRTSAAALEEKVSFTP